MVQTSDYLSVSTLTQYLKAKFERDPYLGRVYLVGEISNFRLRPNAHQYFSLKDDQAKIQAIMFKSAFNQLKFKPEEGMKVLVVGRISLYEATGNYQIYVEKMEPDGLGALYQAFEQLKLKLTQEGLFNQPKKQLPHFPKRIAVVTSQSGAVIKDIMTTVHRRYPIAQIVLFPAVVQGNQAAATIVSQIKRINELGDYDVLIVGRGGGSIEDLWPFNEEIVARTIADSQIPVISSVGHETDTTIADLVADVRAATPTAAAELATPVLSDEIFKIQQQRLKIAKAFKQLLSLRQQRLKHVQESYVLKQPNRLYEGFLQNVDQAKQHLTLAYQHLLLTKAQQLALKQQRLNGQQLMTRIEHQQQIGQQLQHLLLKNMQQYIFKQQKRVSQNALALDLLSPLKIMGRGYAYVSQKEQILKNIADYQVGQTIDIHVNDGQAKAEIISVEKGENNGN